MGFRQGLGVGRGVPERGRQCRRLWTFQSHIHGAFWVQDIGHRAGEQHQDGGAILLVRLHPDGRILRGDVHDDRLGAQQTVARAHGQRVRRNGHDRRFRFCRLLRHTVHRHQLRVTVPHVQ